MYCHFLTTYFRVPFFICFHDSEHRLKAPLLLFSLSIVQGKLVYTFFFSCRFDGNQFLSEWRGKKIMFVGDSLSLNMWESLSCMIRASVPSAKNSFVRKESQSSVIFQVRSILPFIYFLFFIFQNEFNSISFFFFFWESQFY